MMANDEVPRSGVWAMIQGCSGTLRDRRNSIRFTLWSLAWAVTYVAAHRMLKADLDLATSLVWLIAVVPTLIMIATVFSYVHFLRNADELLQKIQWQGLAMGFGAAVVFVTGYQLLERAGASEMQTDYLMLVMIFGWIAGQMHGAWYYR